MLTWQVSVFIGAVMHESPSGALSRVHCGDDCTSEPPDFIIERVTFDTVPEDKSEEKVIDATCTPRPETHDSPRLSLAGRRTVEDPHPALTADLPCMAGD